MKKATKSKEKRPSRRWDRDYYVNAVHYYLLKRILSGATRTPEGEVDFLMGAMVVFFAFGRNEEVPGSWIFQPLCGKRFADGFEGKYLQDKMDNILKQCPKIKEMK